VDFKTRKHLKIQFLLHFITNATKSMASEKNLDQGERHPLDFSLKEGPTKPRNRHFFGGLGTTFTVSTREVGTQVHNDAAPEIEPW
jgi:hypothetical protein